MALLTTTIGAYPKPACVRIPDWFDPGAMDSSVATRGYIGAIRALGADAAINAVAYTAVVLARQIFGDLEKQCVVLVGAGEMVQLCGRYLVDHGIDRLLILNRSREKAEELAAELGATAMTLDRLAEALPQADILISSTASPTPVIRRAKGTIGSNSIGG